MIDNIQQSPLSKAQLTLVKRIHKELGILSVRDADTYPEGKAPKYGVEYTPSSTNMHGVVRLDPTTRKKRVIEMHFRDSVEYPDGIPIGTTYVYRVTQGEGQGPDRAFRFVSAKYDIIQDERRRLRAFAYGTRWMTQPERKADANRKTKRRARAADQDMTLAESVGHEIAKSLKSAVAAVTKTDEKK